MVTLSRMSSNPYFYSQQPRLFISRNCCQDYRCPSSARHISRRPSPSYISSHAFQVKVVFRRCLQQRRSVSRCLWANKEGRCIRRVMDPVVEGIRKPKKGNPRRQISARAALTLPSSCFLSSFQEDRVALTNFAL